MEMIGMVTLVVLNVHFMKKQQITYLSVEVLVDATCIMMLENQKRRVVLLPTGMEDPAHQQEGRERPVHLKSSKPNQRDLSLI